MAGDRSGKTASLYRMVMPDHLCPYGLKSKDLLERQGFTVEDHHLKTREETEACRKEHRVDTTPHAFIDGERVGGYDDLREHFGQEVKDGLIYVSGISFATLGYTQIETSGPIRIINMMQALGGFMALTWSATFLYSVCEQAWRE